MQPNGDDRHTERGTIHMSDDLTRRGFLRGSAAAAAALAAGAQMVHAQTKPATTKAAIAPAAAKPKKPDRKPLAEVATTRTKYGAIKLACIGVGGQGGSD